MVHSTTYLQRAQRRTQHPRRARQITLTARRTAAQQRRMRRWK
jgi:hypothetical protein